MENNDIVFVIEDYVEWATYLLSNGEDLHGVKHIAPFYTKQSNPTFSDAEVLAINCFDLENGLLLVKYVKPDGGISYHQIQELVNTSCKKLMADSDSLCFEMLENFIQNIGGRDIHIDLALEEAHLDSSLTNTTATVNCDAILESGKVAGKAGYDQKSESNIQAHSHKKFASYTECASSNFQEAEISLNTHPWMNTPKLRNLLLKAKRKELKGKYEMSMFFYQYGSFSQTYKIALEIAAKYNLINAEGKGAKNHQVDKKLESKKQLHLAMTFD